MLGSEVAVSRQHADARGRDVHAVGRAPIDDLRISGHDGDTRSPERRPPCRRRCRGARSSANPSSMTNAAESQVGRAPIMATSLTVPCTARCPIEPPGKKRGRTTKESVLNARRSPPGRSRQAASLKDDSVSLAKASTNTASTSAADDFPPGTVGERHDLVGEARATPAKRLDALEHLCFARFSGHARPTGSLSDCTSRQSSNTTALCTSWMRWTLSDLTTRQWSTVSAPPPSSRRRSPPDRW